MDYGQICAKIISLLANVTKMFFLFMLIKQDFVRIYCKRCCTAKCNLCISALLNYGLIMCVLRLKIGWLKVTRKFFSSF